MKAAKFALVIIAALCSRIACATDPGWLELLNDHGLVWEAKSGSMIHVGCKTPDGGGCCKLNSGEACASWIIRERSPKAGTANFFIMKVAKSVCYAGYGQAYKVAMSGAIIGTFDYVRDGGNWASYVIDMMCPAPQ